MQMSALSFLIGINLIMLSAHAAVHFTSEVLQGDGISDGDIPNPIGMSSSISTTSSLPRGDVASGLYTTLGKNNTIKRGGENENENENEKGGDNEKDREGGRIDSNGVVRQCPLCMDQITHPAAPLCGHVFCWDCIHTWVNTHSNTHSHSSNNNSSSSSSNIKCPVCRCLFQRESVRPLFGYS